MTQGLARSSLTPKHVEWGGGRTWKLRRFPRKIREKDETTITAELLTCESAFRSAILGPLRLPVKGIFTYFSFSLRIIK